MIVLPNHKNAIPAAEQAVKLARCKLHVAPSLSLPQGAAAAIAFNGQSTTKENMDALTEALQGTRTVEVSRAVANRMTGGVEVRKGDSITLVDGRIIASTENATEALLTGLLEAEAGNATIVTIYIGAEFEGSLEELAERCEGTLGGVELELIKGGQPLYELVASVEE